MNRDPLSRDLPPKQAPASRTAAGLKALWVTYDHVRRQTGTLRALRVLGQANQSHGFDCPGCAWPDPEQRSFAEFCENGAKAILDEATTRRADRGFFEQYSWQELQAMSEQELNAHGRLTEPMVRRRGDSHFSPITYDEAYQLIAQRLAQLPSPGHAAFYTSGRTSNEAAFLYGLMVRAFGTNNLPDCSNLCHESSGVALKAALGIGKGTVRLTDFEASDLVIVVGQNPGTNHPRMLSALRSAKLKGTKIVSINPLVEAGLRKFAHPQHPGDILFGGVELADLFVQVGINGDQALFRALSRRLLAHAGKDPTALDHEFIEQYTLGFDEYAAALRSDDEDTLLGMAGVSVEVLESLLQLITASRSIIVCWAMGLTQHENAVDTILEVTNFLLLRGNVGKSGAGACPVRGHSNVQGDRTMGIAPSLAPAQREPLERHFGLKLPEEPGLDSVAAIEAMQLAQVQAFISLGGNFLSASPDTHFTEAALARTRLNVQIATKPNKSHLVDSELTLLLPCLGRTELDVQASGAQFVTVENSMGVVHKSQGTLPPASSSLRSEVRIICELAHQLFGSTERTPWLHWADDYSSIRGDIAQVIPGFADFNQRLEQATQFELPNGPRERRFTTDSGKAHFFTTFVRRMQAAPGELVLMTVRSHDQFNTTVYSNSDRYRGISENRRVLLMHTQDLAERGLKSGDRIKITSHFFDGQTRQVKDFYALAYDVPRGSAVAYFPEANPLIFVSSYAEQSRTPTSKSIRITVAKQEGSTP